MKANDIMSSPVIVVQPVAGGAISVQGRELGPGDGLATIGGTITLEGGRDAEALVFDLPV